MEIIKYNIDDYTVYEKKSNVNYRKMYHDWLKGIIPFKQLSSGNPKRKVFLVHWFGKKYIIKHDREVDERIEKIIQEAVFGPLYSKLIYRIDRAKKDGLSVTQDLYFVMEKTVMRKCIESIAIFEYIDGKPLHEFSDDYKNDIVKAVIKLHKFRLASNDIHPGNFILTPDGNIKIIDLSCKGSFIRCKANDLMSLRDKLGFNAHSGGVICKLFHIKNDMRDKMRTIRYGNRKNLP